MKDLVECRKEIDEIDEELMKLFEKRMHVVSDVIAYKLAHNMDIFQGTREKEVIEKNVSRFEDESLKIYAKDFLESMMNVSKSYQQAILDKHQECK